MMRVRYEVRVNGRMSERARSAFRGMEFRAIPPQTIIFGELAEESDLRELLALCGALGLEVVSLQRLPARRGIRDLGSPLVDEAAALGDGEADRHALRPHDRREAPRPTESE